MSFMTILSSSAYSRLKKKKKTKEKKWEATTLLKIKPATILVTFKLFCAIFRANTQKDF